VREVWQVQHIWVEEDRESSASQETQPFLQEVCGHGLNFRDGGGGNVIDCKLEKDCRNNIIPIDPNLAVTSDRNGIQPLH